MLIAEELLLLALDPVQGRPVHASREPLTVCLSGALVAELALDGRVVLEGKRFAVAGDRPGEPLLGDAYDAVASGKGRRAADQLRRLDRAVGRSWKRVVDGLVDDQVLGRERRGPWHVTCHPVLRPALRDEVVTRLRAAAAGDGPLDPRTAVVLALSGPARLLEVVADKPHAHAKRRIAEATELTPAATVVKQVLAEIAAAVAASVAVAAATSSS